MKKSTSLIILCLILVVSQGLAQQTPPFPVDGDNNNFVLKATSLEYSDFWQDGGIRGLMAGCDLDKDGLYEIICSDYDQGGRVHIFEVIGDNQIQWIWSSPSIGSSTQTTCRFTGISDLDGDGKQEILLSISEQAGAPRSDLAGIQVYEWLGQNNQFGSAPLAIIRGVSKNSKFSCDSFFAKDVDKDFRQELVFAINGDDDYFLVYSVTGDFEQANITWVKEAELRKNAHFQGDAINVLWCDMDGDGDIEIMAHSYLYPKMMFLPIEVTGVNQYSIGNSFIINEGINDVNKINGVALDINNDGRDEVFYNGFLTGNLYLLSTDNDALTLNSANYTILNRGKAGRPFLSNGMAWGDQDHGFGTDGPDIYIGSGGYSFDLFNCEYTGGSIKDSSNYQWYEIYHDSRENKSLATMVVAPAVDLDKDGNRELVLGYQSIPDSVNGQAVDKKWLRILEFDFPTSVKDENLWTVRMPEEMFLVSNYPNPFQNATTFALELRGDGLLKGTLYNILGKRVSTLVESRWFQAGKYSVSWDGIDDQGRVLPNGVYFAKFNLNGYQLTKRLTIAK